jgi:hypothetical protein
MRIRPSTWIPRFQSIRRSFRQQASLRQLLWLQPAILLKGCGFFQPLDAAFLAAGVPILGSVRDEQSIGRSRYDAMNISYRQRGFHRTDVVVNYTLARAVGYSETGGFREYPRDPQNPFSPFEFGPMLNDERHHLTLAATAHLPWGMEFSPILQVGSARPYNPAADVNLLNLSGGSSAGALVVPNSDPNNLTAITTKLAGAQCYYAGSCHVAPFNLLRGEIPTLTWTRA